jgi:exosortase D (VPLPA-CTERM-specific)
MVDNWGTAMAEGFLHDFEGWIIFLICMILLFMEMWLFSRLSGRKVAWSDLVQIPSEWSDGTKLIKPNVVFNKSIFLLLFFLCSAATASHFIQGREDIIPDRKAFLTFPLQLGKWQGRNDYLSQNYLDGLRLTDYVIINYVQAESGSNINFYSAYYQTQRKGISVHSPKGCIPGDGWQITQFGQNEFPDITLDGNVLKVNRAVIEKGESRQLVYYWFQQRGRTLTDEFLVKWYLFYDAITMGRTDGSLIRLVTNVGNSEDMKVADQRLQSFMKDLIPAVPDYLPGKLLTKQIS